MRKNRTKEEIRRLCATVENLLQGGASEEDAAEAAGISRKDLWRWLKDGRIRAPGQMDVKQMTSNPDPVQSARPGLGAPDPTPGPAPTKAADPEGLRAALGAAGEDSEDSDQASGGGASGDPFPDVQPIPDAERRDKRRQEQEDFVIESAEAIKETMLEVLVLKYSPPLDGDKPSVRKLARISAMTRKSIKKNAHRLAPQMEALLGSPFALFGLVLVETVAMAAMLKREAVKAGWKPDPKPDPASRAQPSNGAAAPAPGQPGAVAPRKARGEMLPANMIDPYSRNPPTQ